MANLLEIAAMFLSWFGTFAAVLDVASLILTRTEFLISSTRFVLRFVAQKTRFYSNLQGLRVGYSIDRQEIRVPAETNRLTLDLENISNSFFVELAVSITFQSAVRITDHHRLIVDLLKDDNLIRYVDQIPKLGAGERIRRCYPISFDPSGVESMMVPVKIVLHGTRVTDTTEKRFSEELKDLKFRVKA